VFFAIWNHGENRPFYLRTASVTIVSCKMVQSFMETLRSSREREPTGPNAGNEPEVTTVARLPLF
jgi:hypothetical protein